MSPEARQMLKLLRAAADCRRHAVAAERAGPNAVRLELGNADFFERMALRLAQRLIAGCAG